MNALLILVIGLITGICVGIVGIGAGILLIPLLVYNDIPIKTAVATGLVLQLVPQSLPGVWLYNKKGHIDYMVAFYIIIGSLLGITIGSYLVNYDYISEKNIYRMLFIILFLSTIYIGINYL